jgi:hypothetical protein
MYFSILNDSSFLQIIGFTSIFDDTHTGPAGVVSAASDFVDGRL